jgi:hypothetical protein
MSNEEKIFVGNGKIINTQYGDLTKISFSKDDINRMVSFMKQEKSDWINCVLKAKKEPKEGKPTHYLEVDQWKPNEGQQSATESEVKTQESNDASNILPF